MQTARQLRECQPGLPPAKARNSTANLRAPSLEVPKTKTETLDQPMKPTQRSVLALLLSAIAILGSVFAPQRAAADEWWVDGETVFAILEVGYAPDLSAFSGTVAVRMDPVTVSGQFKIVTTILSVTPEPGFKQVIKKNGGVNGTVEIAFTSATCDSKFTFLYKPGLTKMDYGVMRCR